MRTVHGSGDVPCLHWNYIEDVFGYWQKPPHDEFEPRTNWSLYNAFTETAKVLTPPRQLKLLTGIKKVFSPELSPEKVAAGRN